MGLNNYVYTALAAGLVSLLYALYKARWINSIKVEDQNLVRISGYVARGAKTFLYREYKVLFPFVLVVSALLAIGNKNELRCVALSFILGAVCSALAGYFGMVVATQANSRTTEAAKRSLNDALRVSFSGGTVMGMSVVGLALFGISTVLIMCFFYLKADVQTLSTKILPILAGFSLGASSIALFARIAGGIFTKAADVGADLVGKVEAEIPEDDPRNPATIADNVGDNVGDVAGMGADLFESYVGSIIGCMILALAVDGSSEVRLSLVALPLVLCAIGVISSIVGVMLVKAKDGDDPQKSLNIGTISAAILAATLTFPACKIVLSDLSFNNGADYIDVFCTSVIGLVAGILIGFVTEYFTGTNKKPVLAIVKACDTGPATTLITGMGMGMLSTFVPVLIISGTILISNHYAGLYGISMSALGMLLTLGIQLAVDAFGPIADNAGGLAEMSECSSDVRKITDKLDAVGNTTAAIGKGFAIGSAALTTLILFNAFKGSTGVDSIDLTNPEVIVGMLIGGAIPYLFSSLAMRAVGKAAFAMIEEVRRQFRTIEGLLQNKAEADYERCIDISTAAAIKGMVLPGLIAGSSPVLVGFLGGVEMLTGLLAGVTVSGVLLALFMSNAGGAWDNAKKMIEEGEGGGRGSAAHKAAVVGDTVGDPFKDTAGPALNILIKVMAIVSLVIAPMLREYWGI